MTPLAAATQIGGRLMTGSGAVMHALLIDGEMANHGIDHTRIGMTQGHRSMRADPSSTTISSRGVAREHQTEMFPTKGEELTNGMSVSDAYASCHLTYVWCMLYVGCTLVVRSCLPVLPPPGASVEKRFARSGKRSAPSSEVRNIFYVTPLAAN